MKTFIIDFEGNERDFYRGREREDPRDFINIETVPLIGSSEGPLEDVRNRPYLERLAAEKGCELVIANPCELLLDIDSEAGLAQYRGQIKRLKEMFGIKGEIWWTSKSGGVKRHGVISLEENINDTVRVGLEIACGSDPVRGFLGLQRIHTGQLFPSVLFKPKNAVVRCTP